MDYFVVLQTGEETIYPEVHYVFSDDAFHPEADAAERENGDVSVIVDINKSGQISHCMSISPEWQAISVAQRSQILGNNTQRSHHSQLIKIDGIVARQTPSASQQKDSHETDVTDCLALVDELESRREEIRLALSGSIL